MKLTSLSIRAGEEFEDYEDDIERISQEFTSENTSINSTKVPALFHMVHFQSGTVNVDVGGGKFDSAADYLSQYDVINLVYDPYNRTDDHNREVISTLKAAGGADTGTCSNVLNVIKEPEARLAVLRNLARMVKPGGKVYITVYEGRGDGKEGPTKSGYQLHRKTNDYLEEVQQIFPDAHRKGKLIVATNGGVQASVNSAQDIMADDDMLEAIRQEIEDACRKCMMGPDMGFPADTVDDYMVVDHVVFEDLPGFQVRAELGWEGMEALRKACDPIIQKYDKSAYFEQATGGIMEAFLDTGVTSSVSASVDVQTARYDRETGDRLDGLQLVEGGMDEFLELDLNGVKISVGPDGSWEYLDDSFATKLSRHNKDIYSYDGVYLSDVDSVIEALDDLMMAQVPGTEGVYEMSGTAKLAYHIDDIYEGVDQTGTDWDYSSATVEYDPKASTVDVEFTLVGGEDTITSARVSRTESYDIGDTGYTMSAYNDGRLKIDRARPYDDASYYWASSSEVSPTWDIVNPKNRIVKQIQKPQGQDADEDGVWWEVAQTLIRLNKDIEPRMMHN